MKLRFEPILWRCYSVRDWWPWVSVARRIYAWRHTLAFRNHAEARNANIASILAETESPQPITNKGSLLNVLDVLRNKQCIADRQAAHCTAGVNLSTFMLLWFKNTMNFETPGSLHC